MAGKYSDTEIQSLCQERKPLANDWRTQMTMRPKRGHSERDLTRERVRSTFMDDFRGLISDAIPEARRTFDWYDAEHDPQGMYKVDCRINGMQRPLVVHALPSDGQTRDATITLLQFERWGLPFRSLAVFEDQEAINRKVLARYSDVCEKQFSSIAANRERIVRFLNESMAG